MKLKNQFIKLIIFILVILLYCSHAFRSSAQELILKDFKHLEGNTTARIYRKRDVNGQNCAVLIIKHNFKNFKIESGKGYEALEEKTGETWVWLSPDEYRIVIRKEDRYIPFEFNLKDKLKELETYQLVVTDEYGSISIVALGSTIWLNNKQVSKDKYESRLKEGDYIIKATKENCSTDERFIKLIAGDSLNVKLNPIPLRANVLIESEPNNSIGANIIIDGQEIEQKTPTSISLDLGEHKVTLKKTDFIAASRVISLINQENYPLKIQMLRLSQDPQIKKHKDQRNLWFLSTIVFSGIATYSYYKSNDLYNEYKSATTDAEKIRKQYDFYKTLTPIALSVSGISLSLGIIQSIKLHNAKRNLIVSLQIHSGYNSLTLCCNF